MTHGEAPFCWDWAAPDRIRVGSGVSEVREAFVTSLAGHRGHGIGSKCKQFEEFSLRTPWIGAPI